MKCSLIGLILTLPAVTQAQFSFITNNNEIEITRYTGTNSVVVIPSMTNGFRVTLLGDDGGNDVFYNCTFLTSVTIPDSIVRIGGGAFYNCTSLPNVTIPNSVTDIGPSAFINCSSLTNVIIGTNVASIGQTAFSQCTKLTSIAIPNSVTNIGGGIFYICTSLANISIPNSVTSLGGSAFNNCTSLTNVTIGSAVTNIGDYTFQSCSSLTSVTIPDSVTNIGNFAFDGCSSLANATIGKGVVNIGDGAFGYCSLTNITIPNNVTKIGNVVFQFCHSLTNVTIGSGVLYIGSGPFDFCSQLIAINVNSNNPVYSGISGILFSNSQTMLVRCPEGKVGSVVIPDSVINIGYEAFFNCTNLANITFGGGVTNVGTFAFSGCYNVTNVAISSGLTNIGTSWFQGLSGLKAINVDYNNPSYISLAGILFNHAETVLVLYPQGKSGNYTIPNGVISIGNQAFSGCYSLTNVTVPNSITSIGDRAFYNCSSLSNVFFQGNAPSIGVQSFGTPSVKPPFWTYPTCYYLPGTTGWSSTFGGCPTAFWTLPYPIILTGGQDFGVQTNCFNFTISWATNLSVVVETCTNLNGPIWSPVGTNTLSGGLSHFSDSQWTNYPGRFYRLRSP